MVKPKQVYQREDGVLFHVVRVVDDDLIVVLNLDDGKAYRTKAAELLDEFSLFLDVTPETPPCSA
jgi:hypothetical protein